MHAQQSGPNRLGLAPWTTQRAIESMGLLKEAIGVMDEVKRDVA